MYKQRKRWINFNFFSCLFVCVYLLYCWNVIYFEYVLPLWSPNNSWVGGAFNIYILTPTVIKIHIIVSFFHKLGKHTATRLWFYWGGRIHRAHSSAHGRHQLRGRSLDLHPVPEGGPHDHTARHRARAGEKSPDHTWFVGNVRNSGYKTSVYSDVFY